MGNASAFELDALDTRIRELVAYARERDGEDRTLLFRNLVDLFLTGKAPQKQPTRDQLLDVIEALIPHVEPDGRRTVAELVANLAAPPLDLAYRLAKDRPHIVGDLLRSTAFDEDDIIGLIACTGRDHHHVIASRADLSSNVWIALARAAPAAPPFDNQSTLALWRDDLGALHGDETIMPFRRKEERAEGHVTPRPLRQNQEVDQPLQPASNHTPDQRSAPPSAPATVVENRHAAELRILRTDKDLIADRLEKSGEIMQTSASVSESPAVPDQQNATERTPVLVSPELGNWSWQSDRDGLVMVVSNGGTRLFDRTVTLVGGSILDMLGLQNKMGHPVSRAFQRRSAIHDAPIALDNDDIKLRFWTLEATPVFSANGGIFEGYDGVMTPVSALNQSTFDLTDPEPGPAVTNRLEAGLVIDPIRRERPPTATRQTMIDENIDRTAVPAPAPAPTPSPAPAPARSPTLAQTDKLAENQTTSNKPSADLPLANIAAEVLKDLIGDSVSAALGTSLRARQAEVEKAHNKSEQTQNDLQATLHILGETLENLITASKNSGNSNVRLQTEIATACLKTLKDQLDDK